MEQQQVQLDGMGADFTSIPTTPVTSVTFNEGENSMPISVDITDDNADEDAETFTITVSSTESGVTAYTGTHGVVTINDNDDEPTLTWVTRLPIDEGTNQATTTLANVMVNLGGATAGKQITATYTLTEVLDGADIPLDVKLASTAPGRASDIAGVITIREGETSATIPLEIIADAYDEDNEAFSIVLSSPTNAALGTDSIPVTINDDDALPKVSIATGTVETETDADFTGTIAVTLNTASGRTVTVPYTISGTADENDDYTLTDTSRSLTFTPDSMTTITSLTQEIEYTIKGDTSPESEEQFTITLGTPTNGDTTGQNTSSTITIVDNDSSPELSIDVLAANAEVHRSVRCTSNLYHNSK